MLHLHRSHCIGIALLFFSLTVMEASAQSQPQGGQPLPPPPRETLRIPGTNMERPAGRLRSTKKRSCAQKARDPKAREARELEADVVAIDHPMVFNRLGAQNINWMMYALRHDLIDLKDDHPLDYTPEGNKRFQEAANRPSSRGIALRPDLRPRPLVLRVAEGDYLKVRFTNLLHLKPVPPRTPDDPFPNQANPFNYPDPLGPGVHHPMVHNPVSTLSDSDNQKIYRLDDQVASRMAGFHPQGLELVRTIDDDSSYVGRNANSLVSPASAPIPPGHSREYCFFAPKEGAYLVSSDGAVFGGEGTAGNSGVGLFGAVTVQPKQAHFYRAQVTEEEMRLATIGTTPSGQPIIDYEATYPNDCASGIWCREGKVGLPILNMVQENRIIHGDINAIIVGRNPDGSFDCSTYPLESKNCKKVKKQKIKPDSTIQRNPALPNRLEPFREFVSIFHDENAATQAFPYFFEHPELSHTLHGVRDAFMINYGSGGLGAELIANRLKAGPMQDCLDCAYEEFFLSSFTVGDAAMLVDKPANLVTSQCQPEFLDPGRATEVDPFTGKTFEEMRQDRCAQPKDQRAEEAYYPHDPANVHHSYIGDFVKFRNVHSGKEQHVFHLHNHQWLFNPNDDNSNYIDAQGIGPGSGYTYEIAFGGSGNRNKTVGDAIFHCHFYPHFAQGMWYMWRNHDVFESGTPLHVSDNTTGFHTELFGLMHGKPAAEARALPDGEIEAGTPIPAIVPLPGKGMAVMPAKVVAKSRIGLDGQPYGSVTEVEVKDGTENPGYPFWVAGVSARAGHPEDHTSVGSRPTTPPLDMSEIPGVVAGHDGGLPRHALAGYSSGGETKETLDRLTAEKHIEKAMPVYYPEAGTDLEKVAMEFHAVRDHTTHKINMAGVATPAKFVTNGAPPVPGAPYNDPCIDDQGKLLKTGEGGKFFGGTYGGYIEATSPLLPTGIEFGGNQPRVYRGANLQLDVVFNKLGYHYGQQRILTLWEDVGPLLDKTRPPEPLVLRLNTFDCAMYAHTNLVPKDFYADDYQITTPTDVIGQHIHLPKWDLTSADGSANGWNYEDGTFSPGMVRERIHAINEWNAGHPGQVDNPYHGPGDPTTPPQNAPLAPTPHPYFGSLSGHQLSNCEDLWKQLSHDQFERQYGIPDHCDWLGARTTLQRWFSDPLVNQGGIHRGLGITFTHDHLGPSTHQQLGLYATMLTEPPGSEWRHNETGDLLYNVAIRNDGGPTSWQAVITNTDGKPIDVDGDTRDDSHREFFLEFGDFQHAYQKDAHYGVNEHGVPSTIDPTAKPTKDSFRQAINPSVRKPADPVFPDIIAFEPTCPGGPGSDKLPAAVYSSAAKPFRPCPEAISADDIGMMVVNYRNEPIGARVYDPHKLGPDGKPGMQTDGFPGDLAFAMQTRTDRQIPELNTALGATPYPSLTSGIQLGDPFTPIMRAYAGDFVRVKIQAGSHEHEHNGSINGLEWMQGGSGFGEAPHSGRRNAQNAGLSEQFTFSARITDYSSPSNLNDRMYAVDTSQDGLWNGVWGILRSLNSRDRLNDRLITLPSNPKPKVLTPNEGVDFRNSCPSKSLKKKYIRHYHVAAVLANHALPNALGVIIPPAAPDSWLDPTGGTLVYNPRPTTIRIEIWDEQSKSYRTETYGAGPLHDPTAILFVRETDLDTNGRIKPGRPVEPLVLRAAAGECLQIVLHNHLPENREDMPDLDGYTSLSGIIQRDAGTRNSKMTSFNNNLIRPSNRVGLHPQMVHYNVQGSDGNNIGVNLISTVPPGGSKIYHWYAGVLETAPSAEDCPDSKPTPTQLALLNIFSETPTLRPLDDLMTEQAFRKLVRTSLNQKILEGRKAEQRQSDKGAAVSQDSTTNIVNELVNIAAKPIGNGARKFICLEPAPSEQQVASAGRGEPPDEASLGDRTTFYDPVKRLNTRKECMSALIKPFKDLLKNLESADVLALRLANSFYFQVEGVDAEPKEKEPYAWRKDHYPPLTSETTQFVKLSQPDFFKRAISHSPNKVCRFVGIEFGGTNLTPPDRIKQGQKAAVGALIVEPKGAHWKEFTDDDAIDRQDPGAGQVNTRRTRASASVRYPVTDDKGKSRMQSFRDLAMVHQKGLNLRYADGSAVENLAAEKEKASEDRLQTAPEDAHDSGHMAINYGTEPMWFRFGLPPDAPFGKQGFGGAASAWQAFSNDCCDNRTPATGGTVISAQQHVGEPYVPIVRTPLGSELRIRTLMPTGAGRGTTVELHGHNWMRDPYLAEEVDSGSFPKGHSHSDWKAPSSCIGKNPMAMGLGGQESVTPMAHFDMIFPRAGGKHRISGDYLWRDHAGFGITSGLWALLRVEKPAGSGDLRGNCR